MTTKIGSAYVPAQYESWARSTPWGGAASPKVTKFADAKTLPIELGEQISRHAGRDDAVAAAKAFVGNSIKANTGADDLVNWAATRGAVVLREGAEHVAYAATGPLGVPTWALENGRRVPGAVQFADKFRSGSSSVEAVVNGMGEVSRVKLSPRVASALGVTGALAVTAAVLGGAALAIRAIND